MQRPQSETMVMEKVSLQTAGKILHTHRKNDVIIGLEFSYVCTPFQCACACVTVCDTNQSPVPRCISVRFDMVSVVYQLRIPCIGSSSTLDISRKLCILHLSVLHAVYFNAFRMCPGTCTSASESIELAEPSHDG